MLVRNRKGAELSFEIKLARALIGLFHNFRVLKPHNGQCPPFLEI